MKLKQKIAIILLATFVFTNFNQGIEAMAQTLEKIEFNIKYEANKNLLTKDDMLNGENTESGVITENGYNKENKIKSSKVTSIIKNGDTEERKYNYTEYQYNRDGISLISEISKVSSDNVNYNIINQKENYYDQFNNLIKEKNAQYEVIKEYAYNNPNQQSMIKEGTKNTLVFEFDANNRPIKEYNTVGKFKTYEYNMDGEISAIIEDVAKATISGDIIQNSKIGVRYGYDIFGNLAKVDEIAQDTKGIETIERTTEYQYDTKGNLILQQEGVKNGQVSKATSFEYNGLNLVTSKDTVDDCDENYTYYNNGKVKTRVSSDGKKLNYEYDTLGNVGVLDKRDRWQSTLLKYEYKYNKNGNLSEVYDVTDGKKKQVEKSYDSLGRIIEEETVDISDNSNKKLTNEYDITNFSEASKKAYPNVVVADKVVLPSGEVTTKAYDNNGRLKYVIDGDIESGDTKKLATYNYGDNNAITSVSYGDNSYTKYSYYDDYKVNTLTNFDGKNVKGESYQYTYYLNDNPKVLQYTLGNERYKESYSYDKLNRLYIAYKDETVNNELKKERTVYNYDLTNNMTSSRDQSYDGKQYVDKFRSQYVYSKGRLTTKKDTNFDENTTTSTSYGYDSNGNLTEVRNSNSVLNYTYDALNRLTNYSKDNKNVSEYVYNGEDKKVGKVVGKEKTSLVYDGLNVVEEYVNGKLSGQTYYGDKAIFRDDVKNDQEYYYFYNTHNDVTELKLNGATIKNYRYDAFGKEVKSQGEAKVNNPIRYSGYYFEEESNLHYLNARMYNANIKRFMQQDTVRGDSRNPNTLNLYAYSGNNPLAYYDPTGNFFETVFDVIGLVSSAYDFVKEPSWFNFGMLAWDVVSLVPGVPGSYVAKGAKYLNRVDDAVDTARNIDKGKDALKYLKKGSNAVDNLRTIDKVSDGARAIGKVSDAKKYIKSAKEVFQEVTQKAIRSGGDVIKDGRVLATSSKKAIARSYDAVKTVNTKIAKVTDKIASKSKSITSKVQAYANTKVDNVKNFVSKGNPKTKDIYANTKAATPKKAACFTGDTLVKTEDGLKPISEIKVGEKVQAVSDEDVYKDSELKEVTNVIISITDVLIKVTVDEEEIKTTETHPWYVEGKGFINAEYIEVGDKVRTDSGEVKVVEKVEKEKLPIKIVVINLTVKDNRTYFVGENEILVHNTCKVETSSKMSNNSKSQRRLDAETKLKKSAEGNVSSGNIDFIGTENGVNIDMRDITSDGKIPLSKLQQMVPQGTTNTFGSVPGSKIAEGYKYKFQQSGKNFELKWHSPDPDAARRYPGSASGSNWTAQIRMGKKQLLGSDGKFYNSANDLTHIIVDMTN